MSNGTMAVVESRWWDGGNHSVRALFEAIGAIHYDNPSAFYYDMFVDRSSLSSVLTTRATDGRTQVLYLATHGTQNEICPCHGAAISRTEFRNDLIAANNGSQIRGLFLGTCLTGNVNTAQFLLARETRLDWLAGYRDSVDWVDGSAIDMIFFHKLTAEYITNRSRKRGKKSPKEMAHEAASQLVRLVPGAHSQYGFNIYFRDRVSVTGMYS